MNMIFSFLGLLGRVLCAVGDILFDLKGKSDTGRYMRDVRRVRLLYIGGQNPIASDYELVKDENGMLVSRKKINDFQRKIL